ncbi:MAG TPA: adenylate kinase [Frankiaceae bacterium]|nr:adenylate kinase [Frankiaceae bacterium]
MGRRRPLTGLVAPALAAGAGAAGAVAVRRRTGRPAPPPPAAFSPLGPRIVVGGVAGAGKTTIARLLAERRGVPHVELDAFAHQPGWQMAADADFRAAVSAAIAAGAWVVDGNYPLVRDLVWARATTFVWLDPPRGVATWRAVCRTIPRVVRRTELWNGNREEWRNILDPGHPIWWSWTHHPTSRATYERLVADPAYAHVRVTRLRTQAETAAFLRYAAEP